MELYLIAEKMIDTPWMKYTYLLYWLHAESDSFYNFGVIAMKRCFNVEGVCLPDKHYMVNLDNRLEAIRSLIDAGKYFTINRARQYGKTTTVAMLKNKLDKEYVFFSISFEGIGEKAYSSEERFCRFFYGLLYDAMYYGEALGLSDEIMKICKRMSEDEGQKTDLRELSNFISKMCNETARSIILIIDEVDQASNKKIFLDFLGMLRAKYLQRNTRCTFQAVILIGVYDIKNLKQKVRSEEVHQYNSPWNIAADFTIDMSFSKDGIMSMLVEYEKDYHTNMDLAAVSEMIFDYTSGYPYLVSRICKIVDERIADIDGWNRERAWKKDGILKAIKLLVKETSTLFDDIRKKLDDYPKLREIINEILFNGSQIPYNQYNQVVDIGTMFGFLKESNEMVAVSNRIFEMFFYNLFISEQAMNCIIYERGSEQKRSFIQKGYLDMDLVLKKFMEHFTDIYGKNDQKFVEENGRRLFLLYLKPIINGIGNYYIEAQTRDRKRTDVIVDYLGKQYIIELKIWHGDEYNQRGEKQLADYLDAYHVNKGYMISFNFNQNKKAGIHEILCDDKMILEVVI